MFEDYNVQRIELPIDQLEGNRGQVYGLPKNPRFIKDKRYADLIKSIEDDPEYMKVNDLKVWLMDNGKYIVLSGNMRLRACTQLGWKTIPCCIVPKNSPVAKLRAIVIKENEMFGSNDWDLLANEWEIEELKSFGMEMGFLTNDEWDQLPEITEDQEDPVLDKPVKVQVIIPFDIKESESEIRTLLEETLKEYEGVEIK